MYWLENPGSEVALGFARNRGFVAALNKPFQALSNQLLECVQCVFYCALRKMSKTCAFGEGFSKVLKYI